MIWRLPQIRGGGITASQPRATKTACPKGGNLQEVQPLGEPRPRGLPGAGEGQGLGRQVGLPLDSGVRERLVGCTGLGQPTCPNLRDHDGGTGSRQTQDSVGEARMLHDVSPLLPGPHLNLGRDPFVPWGHRKVYYSMDSPHPVHEFPCGGGV